MRNIRKHHHINKEYLIKEYIEKNRSAYDIAQENGVRAKLIIQRLNRFGIRARNIKEANSTNISIEKRKKTCKKRYGKNNISKVNWVLRKIKENTDYKKMGKSVSKSLKKKTKNEWIEIAKKRAITFLRKYGVENVSQLRETKRSMRLSAIRRISRQKFGGGQMYPSFNLKACQIIDEYGKKNGYNFQHALNGGEYYIKELGYWVDGYDKNKNVVIEIDELHHFDTNGQLLKEDLDRQKEIEDHLKCRFVRIKI